MGQIKYHSLILIILILTISSLFIYREDSAKPAKRSVSLNEWFFRIDGWETGPPSILDENMVTTLKLDDYLNRNYWDGDKDVAVYVGYYQSSEKIGAAHDPLVCFPGQGWLITDKETGAYRISDEPGMSITFSSMIVERAGIKALVIYWFQAANKTSSGSLSQKTKILISKVMGEGQENAFVRVTSEIGEKTVSETQDNIFDFIKAFYPHLLKFIDSSHDQE